MADPLVFSAQGSEVVLRSLDAVRKWIDREWEIWSWVGGEREYSSTLSDVFQHFHRLRNEVDGVVSHGLPLNALTPIFSQFYGESGPLLYSEGPVGANVLDIRKSRGDDAATFAYAFVRKQLNLGSVTRQEHLQGAFLAAFPDGDAFSNMAARLAQERRNYRDAARALMDRLEEESHAVSEHGRAQTAEIRSISARLLRRRRQLWAFAQQRQIEQINSSIDSIQAVENTYREAMSLQAPVEYWTTKAKGHEKKRSRLLLGLVGYFVAAAVLLLCAFATAGRLILSEQPAAGHPAAPVALYVVISGALASLSTLVFWVGRLLTKMYLSEHHLHHDSEERAVMTKTYLALTHDKAASDDDRKVILAALFRGTADGIVKDDGPVDFASVAALLAKVTPGK